MSENNITSETEVVKNEETNVPEKANVLLGAISYVDQEEYEKFLENIDVNQAIFVLMAGCNYAQSRGSYNLDESELIAKAIKTIKKSSKNTKETSDQ
jgi:hypothetical protein